LPDEPAGDQRREPLEADSPEGDFVPEDLDRQNNIEAGIPVSGDLGPCLYLGPAGQRCSRRALEGGFCARHQPEARRFAGLSVAQISRRAVAIFGLLAVLWPVLADVIRELIRLLR
jgi:hypothetical protein